MKDSDNIFEDADFLRDINGPARAQTPAVVPDDDIEEAPMEGASADGYTEESIRKLEGLSHIRKRPGMYIGKLGDGSHADDGIYVLLKEVLDNSIDEFNMSFGKAGGKRIDINVTEGGTVSIRDYGRGIPLGKVRDVAMDINTGGKFDNKAFKKSVGLNGVGLKAVNALSSSCEVMSVRDGKCVRVSFVKGELAEENEPADTREPNGTLVCFTPDDTLFRNFRFRPETIEEMVANYTYLNAGLQIYLNGKRYVSRHGLLDLLKEKLSADPLYPVIHLKGEDIEIAITHTDQYGEEFYSFVNGQYTTQGGTHLAAFREHVARTIKEFSGKGYEFADIRNGMVAAISVRIEEPVFESQTKTKLGSKEIAPESPVTVNKFIGDFVKRELDNYLHKNTESAEAILTKVARNEKTRKAMAGVAKLAREKAKKVSLHNKKLRDCRVHFNDTASRRVLEGKEHDSRDDSSIFITEGLSATGTITKVRDARTQAVFSLRGKPKNSYGLTREVVYKNEEFNLLQAALNIEEGLEGLRYNKVIIATDADVDGMHIRSLTVTFFLMFFPELVKKGHVYILQTPLFRVRDKRSVRRSGARRRPVKEAAGNEKEKTTVYCYSDAEREAAVARFGVHAEITRFKGLGEINDSEFADFIGPDMRLEQVKLQNDDNVEKLLEFYMGKNTPQRQQFVINNLRVEDDSDL